MANLVFIAHATSNSTPVSLTLDDIPDEVKKDAEEAYSVLQKANGRLRATFPTVADLNTYVKQMKAYCALRVVDGKPAPIDMRRSPTKNLKPTEMDFRVTDLKTENEKKTEEIREATEAVKTAAKK